MRFSPTGKVDRVDYRINIARKSNIKKCCKDK